MPPWRRALPTYLHETLIGPWVDDPKTIDVEKCVPIPTQARRLDWERILKYIQTPSRRRHARDQILRYYLDLFIDGDHRVIMNQDEHLYFRQSKSERALSTLWGSADKTGAGLEKLSVMDRRAAIRPGYSLAAFAERSDVGTHHVFERRVKDVFGVPQLTHVLQEMPYWMKGDKSYGARKIIKLDGVEDDKRQEEEEDVPTRPQPIDLSMVSL
jgi:hypothetical protein